MASGVEVETRPTAVMTEEYVVIGGGGAEPQVEVATEVPDVGGEEYIVDANTFVGEEVVVGESGQGQSINEVDAKGVILVMYFITIFCITMKRQIKHMIRFRYLPFTWGKPKFQAREEAK